MTESGSTVPDWMFRAPSFGILHLATIVGFLIAIGAILAGSPALSALAGAGVVFLLLVRILLRPPPIYDH
ncbi:MAG TPA: hypothetical protein VN864_07800 [Thermoplasmata archaeon]|nr:hypothetical protein [Thermoplasmata archaeon]